MKRLLTIWFCILFGFTLSLGAQESTNDLTKTELAESDSRASDLELDDPKNIDIKSLTELRVKLLGEDGENVVGAAVMPYAMRMVNENAHGYWNREKLGSPKDFFSDEDGVATIRYPAKVYSLPQPMTTSLVTFQIRHSDFVTKVVHLELGPDYENAIEETEVQLKKGCELVLSAQDENEVPIEHFGVVMAGYEQPEFWASVGQGGKRTSSLNDGTHQTLLVKPQDDGPTLFSGLLPLRVRPNQALKIRNVKLSPGSRVVGQLSKNVTRPVRDGYAITTSVPRPAGESSDKTTPSLTWEDWAEINEDGSFELPSVPRSGEIQIIAICEGWVSTTTVPEARGHVMGQLFDVDETLTKVDVEMEETGVLEVIVTRPDGGPLMEGYVSSWPNQRYYKGGSTILGQRYRSINIIENQLRPRDAKKPLELHSLKANKTSSLLVGFAHHVGHFLR